MAPDNRVDLVVCVGERERLVDRVFVDAYGRDALQAVVLPLVAHLEMTVRVDQRKRLTPSTRLTDASARERWIRPLRMARVMPRAPALAAAYDE